MMENTDWLDFTLALLIALLIGIGLILAYRLRILSQRSERWRSENEVARGNIAALEERLTAREQTAEQTQATLEERESSLAVAKEKTSALGLDLVKSNERLAAREHAAKELQAQLSERDARIATNEQRIASQDRDLAKLNERMEAFSDSREQMTLQFKALATDVLRTQSDDFKKVAATQVQGLIAPLQENLGKFETEFRGTQKEAMQERAALKEKLGTLTSESARLSREADNLTKALRGDSKRQGAWGEAILEKLLESSGLEEGREYRSQASARTDEGKLVRPDILISLPGGRELVIDSKVSLVAYDDAVNAEDEPTRSAAIGRHILSLTTHIKGLAAKDYSEVTRGSLDYVIMFVPIEGALADAIRERPDLTALAAEERIMIATPTTLIMALRTIKNVWDVERRNTNAEEIAARAGKLYDKFVGFIDDMEKVSEQLDRARTAHGAALNKLSGGSGNLVRQVEMLKDLRAKTSKSLPEGLLEKADRADAETPDKTQARIPLRHSHDEAS